MRARCQGYVLKPRQAILTEGEVREKGAVVQYEVVGDETALLLSINFTEFDLRSNCYIQIHGTENDAPSRHRVFVKTDRYIATQAERLVVFRPVRHRRFCFWKPIPPRRIEI